MATTVSPHARQRLWERYGELFTGPQWQTFCRTLKNETASVHLTDNRIACYCFEKWFLAVCNDAGVLLTFLSPNDATDEDKRILRNSSLYRKTGNDAFGVQSKPKKLPLPKKAVKPPEAELPEELLESAEKLMKKELKRRSSIDR